MEQRERDESSSKLEEALRELTGAETTGKIEEYENEREGADVDSETACTDMRRAERMPAWRQEEDARKSKLSESRSALSRLGIYLTAAITPTAATIKNSTNPKIRSEASAELYSYTDHCLTLQIYMYPHPGLHLRHQRPYRH